jgi:hypothetical protein
MDFSLPVPLSGDYPGILVIKSSLSQPQKTPQLTTEQHHGDTDT